MKRNKGKPNFDILNKVAIDDYIQFFEMKNISKAIDITENDILSQKSKATNIQRVKEAKDIKAEQEAKNKKNILKPGNVLFELYREIIKETLIRRVKNERVYRYIIINNIIAKKKYNGDLHSAFDKWRKDYPATYEQLVIVELIKLLA